MPFTLHAALFFIFCVIFTIGVIVNLAGPKAIIDSYARRGFPAGFRFITALFEAISLLLLYLGFDKMGYALALIVMGGAVVILALNKDYKPIIAPALTIMIVFLLV